MKCAVPRKGGRARKHAHRWATPATIRPNTKNGHEWNETVRKRQHRNRTKIREYPHWDSNRGSQAKALQSLKHSAQPCRNNDNREWKNQSNKTPGWSRSEGPQESSRGAVPAMGQATGPQSHQQYRDLPLEKGRSKLMQESPLHAAGRVFPLPIW